MKLTEADEQYFENVVYLKAIRDERGILGLIPDYERRTLEKSVEVYRSFLEANGQLKAFEAWAITRGWGS